jgi:hypothetical protein
VSSDRAWPLLAPLPCRPKRTRPSSSRSQFPEIVPARLAEQRAVDATGGRAAAGPASCEKPTPTTPTPTQAVLSALAIQRRSPPPPTGSADIRKLDGRARTTRNQGNEERVMYMTWLVYAWSKPLISGLLSATPAVRSTQPQGHRGNKVKTDGGHRIDQCVLLICANQRQSVRPSANSSKQQTERSR